MDPLPVAEYGGETILHRREGEPVRLKLIFVRLKEGRACEHGQVHRADIMAEAGKRLVFTAPPGSLFASTTATRQPLSARQTAAASPLCPAPITTAS
jgi:hypothetical protein